MLWLAEGKWTLSMNGGVEYGKSHLIPTIRSDLMFFKGEMKSSKERFHNKATLPCAGFPESRGGLSLALTAV